MGRLSEQYFFPPRFNVEYRNKEMLNLAKELGRPLTDEESRNFITGIHRNHYYDNELEDLYEVVVKDGQVVIGEKIVENKENTEAA
ncbi:MAG: hypothetical protein LBN08_02880 [Lactobacillales bacterium]|jgi:hypothetical protein|nr:hypothetical protein [Lactobacillales bacterium]